MRRNRKDEHLQYFSQANHPGSPLFDQVFLETQSFPELSFSELDPSAVFMGKKIGLPLMINAMTGGTEKGKKINASLARLARDFHLPLQLGSMRLALEEPESIESFRLARDLLGPEPVLLANLGSEAREEEAQKAMDLIEADGIGIHINPAQELSMAEGDRDFRGTKARVEALCRAFPGRIIVKEVGFGFSIKDSQFLSSLPLDYIDVSGAGGTNFMEIEDLRRMKTLREESYPKDSLEEFYDWGIPTALSILNVKKTCPGKKIIAGGGIRKASDLLKAIALGADYGAVAGALLKVILTQGEEGGRRYLEDFRRHFLIGMALLGAKDTKSLKKVPYRLMGQLRELAP